MKKIYIGILTIVYMAVSTGIAMEIHYCMGKQAGMEFYGSTSDKCGKCGMTEKDNGCCHDDHQFYKLDDSHNTVFNDISFGTDEITLVNEFTLFDWQTPINTALKSINNHSPPNYAEPSFRILNCVFRI